jgi:hypothetical protein
MKKCFEDKVRDLIIRHNKNKPVEQQINEVKVKVNPRIGFTGNEQIIVNYWTR